MGELFFLLRLIDLVDGEFGCWKKSGRYFAECNEFAISVRETDTWQTLETAVHKRCEINVLLHRVGFWVDGLRHPLSWSKMRHWFHPKKTHRKCGLEWHWTSSNVWLFGDCARRERRRQWEEDNEVPRFVDVPVVSKGRRGRNCTICSSESQFFGFCGFRFNGLTVTYVSVMFLFHVFASSGSIVVLNECKDQHKIVTTTCWACGACNKNSPARRALHVTLCSSFPVGV